MRRSGRAEAKEWDDGVWGCGRSLLDTKSLVSEIMALG